MKLYIFTAIKTDFIEEYMHIVFPNCSYKVFEIRKNYKLFIFPTINERYKTLLNTEHFDIIVDGITVYKDAYSYYKECNKNITKIFIEKCMAHREYCRKQCLDIELEDIGCKNLIQPREKYDYKQFIVDSLNIDINSLNDIAWLFYLIFSNEIVYSNGRYYKYVFSIWVEAYNIFDILVDRLVPNLIEYNIKPSIIKHPSRVVHRANAKRVVDHINNLISFDIPNDTPGHLLAFNNGIYAFKAMTFIQDKYKIFNMLFAVSTHIDYKIVDIRPAETFLKDLFADNEQYEFYNLYRSSLVRGGNRDKIFLVKLGDGNNGKSILEKLDLLLFGGYACVSNSSILTNSKPAESAATPELLDLRNKGVVYVNEPENKPLSIVGVKELTGNDLQRARVLYKKNIQSFELQCKFIMVCNAANLTTASDTAFWNRVEILYFKTEFKEIDINEETKYIRKMNKDINLNGILHSHLSLLIQYYEKYNSMTTIRNMCRTKNNVRYKCDTIYRFTEETNVLNMNLSRAYELFKHWYIKNSRVVTASSTLNII